MRRFFCLISALFIYACSATQTPADDSANPTATAAGSGGGLGSECGFCDGLNYIGCDADGLAMAPELCQSFCDPDAGCLLCNPDSLQCIGNDVWRCNKDGSALDEKVKSCDPALGEVCSEGSCRDACEVAEDQPSNVGCTFWAVDLDQVDAFNDPASAPWGVALANAGQSDAQVVIEINQAAPGAAVDLKVVDTLQVPAGQLIAHSLPTREVDCGLMPNDYAAPGTCLSSAAYRIRSTAPLVVYQFNVFENAFSNDASLLLPQNALGKLYRVLGWVAGHPVPLLNIVDRSAITIVGTQPDTTVKVKPSWRIRGNAPIAPTPAGGSIEIKIGPFDVLNLETDDATFGDDPKTVADLSGSVVTADKPIAVFSGVETTSAPAGVVSIPTYPGWSEDSTCCLDHLEEQMFPVESIGSRYVITRSPIRSTGSYHEPDILRFMGVAQQATVKTNLPAPFDNFTLAPGEVRTTWTQGDVIVEADEPVMVGQILVSNGYVDGPAIGDPALTVFPPVDQYRSDYLIVTPASWTENYVVAAAPTGTQLSIDGQPAQPCTVNTIGLLGSTEYQSLRCPLQVGVHRLSADRPFGIIAYGYGSAGSYAFAGGANVEKIYEPPPLR